MDEASKPLPTSGGNGMRLCRGAAERGRDGAWDLDCFPVETRLSRRSGMDKKVQPCPRCLHSEHGEVSSSRKQATRLVRQASHLFFVRDYSYKTTIHGFTERFSWNDKAATVKDFSGPGHPVALLPVTKYRVCWRERRCPWRVQKTKKQSWTATS